MTTALEVLYGLATVEIKPMLTLTKALKTGRLREFVAQEEARGIGPGSRKKLDTSIKNLATTPLKSKGRTSRSTSRGGSNGK